MTQKKIHSHSKKQKMGFPVAEIDLFQKLFLISFVIFSPDPDVATLFFCFVYLFLSQEACNMEIQLSGPPWRMSDSLKYIWQEKEPRLFRGGLCFVLLFTLDVKSLAHNYNTKNTEKKHFTSIHDED